jgi:hypothetical protein
MMTMPKRLFYAGSLLTATFAGLLVFHLLSAPRTTETNYQKIDKGMRLSDVEALLGRPIGNRIAAMNFPELCSSSGTRHEEFACCEGNDEGLTWSDRGGTIRIGIGPAGTVTYKRYDPAVEESLLHMARRWFGF